MNNFENKLKQNIGEYHQILKELGLEIYRLYKTGDKYRATELFLKTISIPRKSFLEILGQKGLNYGSSAGLISEWYFYYLIDALINAEEFTDKFKVYNNYALPYKWKKKGNKEVKIDIVVRSEKQPKNLVYCIEVKTNFEDGFSNYYKQQNAIFHHRSNVYKDFRYHYVSFTKPPGIVLKNHKRELNTLKRRNQLWIFPLRQLESSSRIDSNHELLESAQSFLGLLYGPLLNFKHK